MPKKKTTTTTDALEPGPMPNEPLAAPDRATAAAVAWRLAQAIAANSSATVLFIAGDERRADEIGRALPFFAPGVDVLVLPPWDCLPYDRASPSRACMGRRAAVLHKIAGGGEGKGSRREESKAEPKERRVVVTSPEAVMQKIGSVEAPVELTPGNRLDRDQLLGFAARCGYLSSDRVDEPGDIAVYGRVVDLWPADANQPVRLDLDENDGISEIRTFDPVSHRTADSLERVVVVPASELALPDDVERVPGIEHKLPAYQPDLSSLFERLAGAALAVEPDALANCRNFAQRVDDAYKARQTFTQDGAAPQPSHLYLQADDLDAACGALETIALELDGLGAAPLLANERDPLAAFAGAVRSALSRGHRVFATGLSSERSALERALKRGRLDISEAADLHAPARKGRGRKKAEPVVAVAEADLDRGFDDERSKLTVIAASDVFGARAADGEASGASLLAHPAPQPGDVVVHEDHGVAVLDGLERLTVDDGVREVLRLSFRDADTLMVPTDELDRIWRYGSAPDAVTLDRLDSDGWNKRRVKINGFVEDAAAKLVEVAERRAGSEAPVIEPPSADYARFAARFPFPETRDQSAAIAAVLADLKSGRQMNRLICGDVGFGKTEVALRAAAAVALAGKQVALVAPTTILARQHAETFEKRFAGTGIEVVQLSRLVDAGDVAAAKKRLADGKAQIVIGTQMVAGDAVLFADLALVIVDEEHRFGTKVKQTLETLAPHHLALSATPIPRTLQGALVGVQEVSVLAAPPARRRPVRTFVAPFDAAAAGTALLREARRDGQSFVVVPRIEDIDEVRAMVGQVAPDLSVETVHGRLAPEEVDDAMLRFAAGEADVLIATSLIENGLDVPRANTMLVWGADRFGLAQLHQLRGRVGRGRVQGIAYLFTPDDEAVAASTTERLSALAAADRLGAGFELSARDLDLRGGGDLLGEEQAGHMKLIGAGLYQHLLQRAVRVQKGEARIDRRAPSLKIAGDASFPESFVPEPTLRLELLTRLARLDEVTQVEAFHEEMEDRFGELPPETVRLLARRRVSILAQQAGVTEIVIGPKGAALSFTAEAAKAAKKLMRSPRWKGDRLVLDVKSPEPDKNLASLEALLLRLAPVRSRGSRSSRSTPKRAAA